MRQLAGDSGEMPDALVTSHQQIHRVFGWLLGWTRRGDLVQHGLLLSRKRQRQNAATDFTDDTDKTLVGKKSKKDVSGQKQRNLDRQAIELDCSDPWYP
jgi:hypothetical protein